MRGAGHAVAAAAAIGQGEFHELPGAPGRGLVGGQLQPHAHHVRREALQLGHTHGHFARRVEAGERDLIALQHHMAQRAGAACQGVALRGLVGGQGAFQMPAQGHLAVGDLAFARAAGALLAAIGQAHALAQGGGQHGNGKAHLGIVVGCFGEPACNLPVGAKSMKSVDSGGLRLAVHPGFHAFAFHGQIARAGSE